jgi:hypothetical protein|nr:MAG TPA: Autoinducer synthase [Caudoviricetes sp.]
MKKKIASEDGYTIYQIEKDGLLDAIKFVCITNYKKHHSLIENIQLDMEVVEISASEYSIFDYSYFYVVMSEKKQLIGTLRVHKIDKNSIDLPDCIDLNSVNTVYHIGRFAIDSNDSFKLGNDLFRKMILLAFSHICQHENNIMIAECDMKLYKVLLKMGINIVKISSPFICLGSETVLVYARYENIIEYYLKYNSLQQL